MVLLSSYLHCLVWRHILVVMKKQESFKKELVKVLLELGATKQYPEGSYIFNGSYIDISRVENMKDLILYFYREGSASKVREVKNVLNIIDPRF